MLIYIRYTAGIYTHIHINLINVGHRHNCSMQPERLKKKNIACCARLLAAHALIFLIFLIFINMCPLCMCPHTTICVLILLYVSSYCCYICVLNYYMCPHTAAIYVSSYYYMCPHTAAIYVSSYYYINLTMCALILLYICPDNTIYVSSDYFYVSSCYYMCPHTSIYVSLYCIPIAYLPLRGATTCVLILVYMLLHVSSH
jgi:hypothetical protein